VRLDETHRRSSRGQHDHLDDSRPDFSAGFFALMKERALRRSTLRPREPHAGNQKF
jgi:hypothetical protein